MGTVLFRQAVFGYDGMQLNGPPKVTQETTLSCVSNSVGGGLQSNAMWVGVPMRDLITQAGPEDGVVEVLLRGVDGYTDTFFRPLLVRATDRAGAPQDPRQRSSVPEGATGYHRVMAKVKA